MESQDKCILWKNDWKSVPKGHQAKDLVQTRTKKSKNKKWYTFPILKNDLNWVNPKSGNTSRLISIKEFSTVLGTSLLHHRWRLKNPDNTHHSQTQKHVFQWENVYR